MCVYLYAYFDLGCLHASLRRSQPPTRDYVRENAANIRHYVKPAAAQPSPTKYKHKDNGKVPK